MRCRLIARAVLMGLAYVCTLGLLNLECGGPGWKIKFTSWLDAIQSKTPSNN